MLETLPNADALKQVIAIGTILLVFCAMMFRKHSPTEVLFCGALGVYVFFGIITPEDAWKSFANQAVIAIGGLLIVTAALRTTGVLDYVGSKLLGDVRTETGALLRLSSVLIVGSAFLLNTAIVVMLMPIVIAWCRRHAISPSRILLPISYLAILGGTCSLLGTSTNLVIDGELASIQRSVAAQAAMSTSPSSPTQADTEKQIGSLPVEWLNKKLLDGQFENMQLTEISRVGVPCALVGALVLIFLTRRLIPNRVELIESLGDTRREYLVELMVTASCPLIGKTVEEGGLRGLPGLFLIEIDRSGEVITPVAPSDRIVENDRLVFTGVVSTIVDLEKIKGLVPAADINYEIGGSGRSGRILVEVVLSPTSPLVGRTIRQANFRQLYNAAVVAVHRNGKRMPSKIGAIELAAGDTLLLQSQRGFVKNFRNRPDFYLVSGVEDSDSRRYEKFWLAIAITVSLIAWLFFSRPFAPPILENLYGPYVGANVDSSEVLATGEIANADNIAMTSVVPEVFTSAPAAIFVAALLLIFTRCLTATEARAAIDWPMLITVGAAIGVGRAVHQCGAGELIASSLSTIGGSEPHLSLAVIFLTTVVLTEMITNVAVAAMMFSVAIELAHITGSNPRPFIMAVTMAASLSFISPIGYQTNMLVMGPGGYRPLDYLKVGLPLSLSVGAVAVIIIPMIWPF